MEVKDLTEVLLEIEEVKIVDLKLSRTWRGMVCQIPSYYYERLIKFVYSSYLTDDINKYVLITIK